MYLPSGSFCSREQTDGRVGEAWAMGKAGPGSGHGPGDVGGQKSLTSVTSYLRCGMEI